MIALDKTRLTGRLPPLLGKIAGSDFSGTVALSPAAKSVVFAACANS
jgi:hypothetical protein